MTRAFAAGLAAGLVVALAVSVAAAQPTPAPPGTPMKTQEKAGTKLENDARGGPVVSLADEKEARIDFLAGNDYLNNGLFLQAVDKYTEALAHWNHPAIHYNIALALINLDRPLEVYDHLTKAIAYGPAPLDKDKYDYAQEYLRLVGGQLADIEVSCDKPGARVAVDGSVVFVGPGKYTAKVRVGKHSFLAEKRGYSTRSTAPFIGPGEKYRIDLELYTAEDLTRYHRRWNKAWMPYSVIGAGVLFGLAGGGLELSARSSFRDYDAAVARCSEQSPNHGCDQTTPGLLSMRDSGDHKRTAGIIMYGLAGSAIVAGGVLVYLNRRQAYQISAEDLNEKLVTVTPMVAPGMAGALVRGHF